MRAVKQFPYNLKFNLGAVQKIRNAGGWGCRHFCYDALRKIWGVGGLSVVRYVTQSKN